MGCSLGSILTRARLREGWTPTMVTFLKVTGLGLGAEGEAGELTVTV